MLGILPIACGGPEIMIGLADNSSPSVNQPNQPVSGASTGSTAEVDEPSSAYGDLPLAFEPNSGQTNSRVQFLAKVQGYNLFITGTEIVFDVVTREPSIEETLLIAPDAIITTPGESVPVRFSLIGANPDLNAEGLKKLAGVSNYLIGNDPSKWVIGVERYEGVLVSQVYPGIDVEFYGAGKVVEHDYIVAPGIDPGQIQFEIKGALELFLAEDGDLEVILNEQNSKLIVKKPIAYQKVNGNKVPVHAEYLLLGDNIVTFWLGDYDTSLELVIDPVTRVYTTFLGGTLDDITWGIDVDSSGNVFTVGYTKSTNFPTQGGLSTPNDALQGNFDAFVTKLDSNGSNQTYSTYLGGSALDLAESIKVDGSGNVYIAGYTTSTDFPGTTGFLQENNAGGYDAFIAKLNSAGNSLTYATYLGGTGFETGTQIALDTVTTGCTTGGSACVVLVGTSTSTGLSTGGVVNTTGDATNGDAFAMRLNSGGTTKSVFTYLGGTGGRDLGLGVAVDSSANVYITGETKSSTFVPTPGGLDTTLGGTQDAFVVKLNAAMTTTSYSTYFGGSGKDGSAGIGLDIVSSGCTTGGSACAVITGTTDSTDLSTANANDATSNGGDDVYIMSLNSGGSALNYSTYVGGSGDDRVLGTQSIFVDASGEAWVTGTTSSTEATFPILNAVQATYPTGSDFSAFIMKVAGGTTSVDFSFVTYHGGTTSNSSDIGVGIVVDSNASDAYVTGIAETTDFPTAGTPFDSTQNGGLDGFVAKYTTLPITFRAQTEAAANSSDITINVPAGTVDNDVMLMAVAFNDDAVSATTPTGWTEEIDQAQTTGGNADDGRLHVFSRVASSEPASYTVTLSGGVRVVGSIVSYENVNPTNPLDGTPTSAATADSTTHDAPTMTTSLSNSMLITFHVATGNETWTPPTGMTERTDVATNNISMEVSELL
ncbi:MAG: SBBP repeat-containing protein, partial [Deltaproteobacteria bacterium]|nr:SBBP repeat-containing protein [Deltaproteobacteria bacterium]